MSENIVVQYVVAILSYDVCGDSETIFDLFEVPLVGEMLFSAVLTD